MDSLIVHAAHWAILAFSTGVLILCLCLGIAIVKAFWD